MNNKLESRKYLKYSRLVAAALAAVMAGLLCFPALAESPEQARTAEEWAVLRDNALTWEEIPELVEEYNATVKANAASYQTDKLASKSAEQTANKLVSMADTYENLASAAENTTGGAVTAASYRVQAEQLRSQADTNTSDYRILLLENERMKRQITEEVRQLFLQYHQETAENEYGTKQVSYLEKAYASAKNLQKYGMGTEIDTLTALESLQKAQADRLTDAADLSAVYKKLITLCGWKYDASAEIGALPAFNAATASQADRAADLEKALVQSLTLQEDAIRLENAKKLYTEGSTIVTKWKNQTETDKNTVANSYNTALSDLQLAKASYDAAAAQAELKNSDLAKAKKQYDLGQVSRMEYAAAQYAADTAANALETAKIDLLLKRAAYDAIVNGLS